MSGLFDQITNYSPPLLTAGQVNYKGTWSAAANSPALVSPPASTSKGDYYVVSAAGTQFGIDFAVGDWIISNGTAWEKVDLTDAVSSVFGRTGAVVGVSTDYSSVGITNTAIGASSPSTGVFTNAYADTLSAGFTSVAAAGTVTTLVVGSVRDWTVTGSGGQTFQLPDATTLRNGAMFQFNNNQSSGTVVVRNNSATTVATLQSGSYIEIILLSNATAAGSWDVHNQAPSNVSWSTNTFDYPGSITSATWNGTAVAINRGGTGQATAQLAINALAGAVTSGSYLRGNGTNVVMNTIQAADVPTLNQNTTGSAATLTTPRAIYGNNFDGSAALTQAIAGTYGGTGVNNGANTITIAGNVTHAGAFTQTFTATANTSLTLPVTGTLATLAGSEALSNKTITASAFNGTVGATTPSTGAFTTLSATGDVTASGGNILSTSGGSFPIRVSGATTTATAARFTNTGGDSYFGAEGNATNNLIVGCTAYDTIIRGPSGLAFSANAGNNMQMRLSSTGLAVTGALSSTTGATFATSSGSVGIGTTTPNKTGLSAMATVNGASNSGFEVAVGDTRIVGLYASSSVAVLNAFANVPMQFSTNNTTRMTIDTSGNLLVGTTTTSGNAGFQFLPNNGACVASVDHITGISSGSFYYSYNYNGSSIGSVSQVGTTQVLFNVNSDYRLKNITGPLTDSGTFIDALKPKVGTWKSDGSKFVGFLAHEFAEVSPSSVVGEKDAVDAEGKPVYQGMQAGTAEVIANLVAQIQELRQRVAALESN